MDIMINVIREGKSMDTVKSEILEKLNGSELKYYLSKLDINNALVFGSLINGGFNEESDVDIAILGTAKLLLKYVLKLEFINDNINEFEKVLEVAKGYL